MKKGVEKDWKENLVFKLKAFLDHILAGWDREWDSKFLIDIARISMLLHIRMVKIKKHARLLLTEARKIKKSLSIKERLEEAYIKLGLSYDEDDKNFLIDEALEMNDINNTN